MPQPPEGDVPALTKRLETLGCRQFAAAENKDKSHYPDPLKKKYKEDEEECFAAAFVLATAKVFNGLADSEAYKVLADEGHPDAMVATGVCLLEGLACEADEEAGKEQYSTNIGICTPPTILHGIAEHPYTSITS